MPSAPAVGPAEWLEQQRRRHGLNRQFVCDKSRCTLSRAQCLANQKSKPLMVKNKGEERIASRQNLLLEYCRSGKCLQGKETRQIARAERERRKSR